MYSVVLTHYIVNMCLQNSKSTHTSLQLSSDVVSQAIPSPKMEGVLALHYNSCNCNSLCWQVFKMDCQYQGPKKQGRSVL